MNPIGAPRLRPEKPDIAVYLTIPCGFRIGFPNRLVHAIQRVALDRFSEKEEERMIGVDAPVFEIEVGGIAISFECREFKESIWAIMNPDGEVIMPKGFFGEVLKFRQKGVRFCVCLSIRF